MGIPQSPNAPSPHLYPQALQLKLYQAFIFSIPILFSIILFLLFYLFYLKRRASNSSILLSSPTSILPTTSNQPPPYIHSPCQNVWTGEINNRLPLVLFDEELSKRESLCCVCLGEFEIKEELHQVPSCKHVFHVECIRHWLHSNATCPLCRCAVLPTSKLHGPPPSPSLSLTLPAEHQDDATDSNNESPENILEEEQTQEQQQFVDEGSSNVINNICR